MRPALVITFSRTIQNASSYAYTSIFVAIVFIGVSYATLEVDDVDLIVDGFLRESPKSITKAKEA